MLALQAFRRALDFKGRSSRAEFISFLGAVVAALVIINVVAGDRYGATIFPLVLLGLAICAVPAYSLTVRRFHDMNREPKLLGLALVLFAGNQLLQKLHESVQFTMLGPVVQWLVWGSGTAMFGTFGYILYLGCQHGDEGENSYGSPPTDDVGNGATQAAGADVEPAGSMAPADPLSQIERLSQLRDAGALTDDEFNAQKAALLKRL